MTQLLINSRIRVKEEAITKIRRSFLQGKGKIHVEAGQEVSPGDILGEGHEVAGFRTLAIALELGAPPGQAAKYLHCRLGQTVYRGELLAGRDRFFGIKKRIIMSPADGVLDSYDEKTGILRIRSLPKTVKLASGVYGIIDQVQASSGAVVIRTKASIIYGILGSGQERAGLLRVLDAADTLVGTRQVLPEDRGDILVGGSQVSLEALKQAMSYNVAGIISGGINLADFKKIAGGEWEPGKKHEGDVGISLLVTEGFGAVPIGPDIFSLLKRYNHKFALLDGGQARLVLPSDNPDSMIDIRKAKPDEVLPVDAVSPIEEEPLIVGARVRIVAPPQLGKQGTVEAIDRTATLLPSGASVCLATVAGQGKIRVPYLNLEIIKT